MSATNGAVTHVSNWNTFFKGMKIPSPPGQPDRQMSLPRRIAFVLDWAAKKGPNIIVPYNVVLREIMGFTHTPRLSNKEVADLRKKLPVARPILQTEYKRDLYNVSGIGVRATTGDLDVVKATTPRAVARVHSAHEALRKNATLVRVDRLPESGPDRGWREWYAKAVTPAVKLLTSDPRFDKLLPPPSSAPTSKLPAKKDDGEGGVK